MGHRCNAGGGIHSGTPGHVDSVVTEWSVDPDDWGEFLCQTFDYWYANDMGKVFVNWFESLVGQWMGEASAPLHDGGSLWTPIGNLPTTLLQ